MISWLLIWIIFWIESWVKEYWMNHFLSKFKHWIESDRVSNTPMTAGPLCSGANKQTSNKERFTQRMDGRRLGWPICLIRLFSNMRTMQRLICSIFKLTSSSLHRIQNSECCRFAFLKFVSGLTPIPMRCFEDCTKSRKTWLKLVSPSFSRM